MPSHSRREREEQTGVRIMPGGQPGEPERPDTHTPPDKPGQFDEQSDRVARPDARNHMDDKARSPDPDDLSSDGISDEGGPRPS